MFYNYKILEVDNNEILYLYVNSLYEFSNEFNNKNKPKSIFNKVNNYIKDMGINFNGKKVLFVVNGIIIGSITLITNDFQNIDINNTNNELISYKENIDLDKLDNIDIIDINKDNINYFDNEIINNPNQFTISNFVKMEDNEGKITYIDLDNYITSELSKIIPPTYEEESIKSAAVVVRTEVFRKLYENTYLNENDYRDNYILKKMWKNNFNKYFKKLKDAVEETNYQILTQNHYYFDFNTRVKYQIPFSSYNANNLAKKGYNYINILGHYYPDANLEIL